MAIAVVVALLLAEGCVRAFAPQQMSGTWRVLAPRGYPVNKAGGTAPHQRPDGTTVVYRFNEQHLRGAPLRDAGLRVLCLGDSFTFGWMLPEEETFVARLQDAADAKFGKDRFQVLNGGAGGWGTDECVAFAEDYGDAIRPDAVVLFLNTWDIGRSLHGGPFALADGTSLDLVASAPSGIEVGGAGLASSATYQWFLEHSHLAQLVRGVVVRMRARRAPTPQTAPASAPASPATATPDGREPPDPALSVRMGQALIVRLKTWCDARKCALVVVTTGRPDPAEGGGTPTYDVAATLHFKKTAPAFLASLGVPWHDVNAAVAAEAGDWRRFEIQGDGHPTREGAALLARHQWRALEPDLARLLAERR